MFQEFVLEHPQIEHFETPVSDSELVPRGIKLSVWSWIPDIRGTVLNIVRWQPRQTTEGRSSISGKQRDLGKNKKWNNSLLTYICTAQP